MNESRSVAEARINRIKALYSIPERFPTFRADIRVLFGKYLPRFGIGSDLLAHVATSETYQTWPAGTLHAVSAPRTRGLKHTAIIVQELRLLWLASRGYDLVIVRDNGLAAVIGLIAARIARIPFVYWMSFPMAEAWIEFGRTRRSVGITRRLVGIARGHVWSWLLYCIALRLADHVFVQSDRMKADLAQKGIKLDRITAVPMGVDCEEVHSLDDVAVADPRFLGRRVIVYLGALEESRRPIVMIHAMKRVLQKFPATLLLLVGDSAERNDRARLEAEVARLGLNENVLFTGWLPVATAWQLLRQAEVGLSPIPRSEILDAASPTKVVEYLALGIPVVGNDQPDQAKVIAESGGGFVVPLTDVGFADGVCSVLDDPVRAREMGASGRRYVEAHRSYDLIARRVAAVIEKIVGKCPAVTGDSAHD